LSPQRKVISSNDHSVELLLLVSLPVFLNDDVHRKMLDELETEIIEAILSIIWDNILENGISLIVCIAAILEGSLGVFNLRNELIKLILKGLCGGSLFDVLVSGEATQASFIIHLEVVKELLVGSIIFDVGNVIFLQANELFKNSNFGAKKRNKLSFFVME